MCCYQYSSILIVGMPVFLSTMRVGWRTGHSFSGPRSRADVAGWQAVVRKHLGWPACSVATANGADARMPDPPARGVVSNWVSSQNI